MTQSLTGHPLLRAVALLALILTASAPAAVWAHDPSAWGGIYRSRDSGASWFLANEGRFVTAALALAISPADSSHLLLATDGGLLRSRNGGRDWEIEGRDVLVGAVFAVAFNAEGNRALAAGGAALASWNEASGWRAIEGPSRAAPARLLLPGAAPARAYLAGWSGLFGSDDWGVSWTPLTDDDDLAAGPVTAMAVAAQERETLLAIASGTLWARTDGADAWRAIDNGLPRGSIEAVAIDPRRAERFWAAGADRLFRSDDRGRTWYAVGNLLSEPNTTIRGIGVGANEASIVLTTDRGLFRSSDGGDRWELLGDSVPGHLEARPLIHDPRDPSTLYAGFSITPYEGLWQGAVDGRGALARVDPINLAGGLAFLTLLGVAAGWALRRLGRYYGSAPQHLPL